MSYSFSTFLFVTVCSQSCTPDSLKDQENCSICRTKKYREIRKAMGEQAPSTSDCVCTKSLQLLFPNLHKDGDPKLCRMHSKALSSSSNYLNLMVSPNISFTQFFILQIFPFHHYTYAPWGKKSSFYLNAVHHYNK